jgi:hypothetical protein
MHTSPVRGVLWQGIEGGPAPPPPPQPSAPIAVATTSAARPAPRAPRRPRRALAITAKKPNTSKGTADRGVAATAHEQPAGASAPSQVDDVPAG